MAYGVKLHVWGEYACFTRPKMKVERVSYDVMTPSAARGILEAIHWKPAIRWTIDRIHVLNPIRFENLRRNELGGTIPTGNVRKAMRSGTTDGLRTVRRRSRDEWRHRWRSAHRAGARARPSSEDPCPRAASRGSHRGDGADSRAPRVAPRGDAAPPTNRRVRDSPAAPRGFHLPELRHEVAVARDGAALAGRRRAEITGDQPHAVAQHPAVSSGGTRLSTTTSTSLTPSPAMRSVVRLAR